MPFKKINLEQTAYELGVNYFEIKEKQRLIERIKKLRKEQNLSQAQLAQRIGVSQGRIAQIESGIGTNKISFDIILHIINELGFNYEVRLKRAA
jgi:DNA-binding XRE family transcriptional regulator